MGVGTVFLVGAGPGDPELLTLKAARIIAAADVVVYDRLIPAEILSFIPGGAARGLARSVRYVTGHCKADEPLDLDWASLADPDTTLVVYMGLANVEEITTRLIAHGLPQSTPVLAISQGTTPRERRLRTCLGDLPHAVGEATLATPVLFVIGRVAALAAELDLNAHETVSGAAAVA
jgi:siroheme synthase